MILDCYVNPEIFFTFEEEAEGFLWTDECDRIIHFELHADTLKLGIRYKESSIWWVFPAHTEEGQALYHGTYKSACDWEDFSNLLHTEEGVKRDFPDRMNFAIDKKNVYLVSEDIYLEDEISLPEENKYSSECDRFIEITFRIEELQRHYATMGEWLDFEVHSQYVRVAHIREDLIWFGDFPAEVAINGNSTVEYACLHEDAIEQLFSVAKDADRITLYFSRKREKAQFRLTRQDGQVLSLIINSEWVGYSDRLFECGEAIQIALNQRFPEAGIPIFPKNFSEAISVFAEISLAELKYREGCLTLKFDTGKAHIMPVTSEVVRVPSSKLGINLDLLYQTLARIDSDRATLYINDGELPMLRIAWENNHIYLAGHRKVEESRWPFQDTILDANGCLDPEVKKVDEIGTLQFLEEEFAPLSWKEKEIERKAFCEYEFESPVEVYLQCRLAQFWIDEGIRDLQAMADYQGIVSYREMTIRLSRMVEASIDEVVQEQEYLDMMGEEETANLSVIDEFLNHCRILHQRLEDLVLKRIPTYQSHFR